MRKPEARITLRQTQTPQRDHSATGAKSSQRVIVTRHTAATVFPAGTEFFRHASHLTPGSQETSRQQRQKVAQIRSGSFRKRRDNLSTQMPVDMTLRRRQRCLRKLESKTEFETVLSEITSEKSEARQNEIRQSTAHLEVDHDPQRP